MKKLFPILFIFLSATTFAQTIKAKQVEGLIDSLTSVRNDTTKAPIFYSFRVGDIGFPQDGDSVLLLDSVLFSRKFIQVFREGFQQNLDTYNGVTYDSTSGHITFHGPLVFGERVYIEGRPTSNRLAYGINGVMTYGSTTSYDADAQTFFSAQATAGNSLSSANKTAFNDFIVGLKNDGVWTKITQMQFLAFGSFNYDKINIKSPGTYNFTSTNGTVSYTTSGESGNASNGYINTGLNPSTAFGNSNIHIATYSRTNSSTVGFDAGASQASTASQVILASGWGTARTRIDDDAVQVDATTSSLGFFVGDRTSSTLLTLYKNGSNVGTSTTISAHGLPNVNIYLHAYNGDGTAGLFIDRQLSFYSVGTHLSSTDVANYNSRVEALMDAYGIGVQ
jgi:hypothetical protein